MKLYARRNIKNYFIVFLFLFFSLIFCEKEQEFHFNTYTTFHENDDKTVTYEHCGSNDQGDFSFSATFEHTSYDTCQNVTCSDISFNYQSDENVEVIDESSLHCDDCHDKVSDADQYDFNEMFNNQNENNSTNFDQKNNGLEQNKKALKNKHKKFQNKIKEAEHFSENELQQAYSEHQLSLQGSDDQKFTKIVKKRNQPFKQSLQDPKKCKNQNFVLKNSTIGFMQANNIDYNQFTQLYGLQIQHYVTQELIANLNTFADIANKNFGNQQLFPLIQSGALVTSMAQDYNQTSQLCDAISATNCSHGFVHYLQGMMVSGHNRCQKLLTSLSFFSCEIAKYTAAIARGVTIGVASSEIIDLLTTGIGKGASIIAPQLTSTVYSGATSIMVPIALTVGTLCATSVVIEGAHIGYLYGTGQLDKVAIELDRIKNFARQFYNFDQAPEKHVENIAMLSTTAVWPWQKQAIFEHLMGMQKVTCNLLIDAKNIVHQTKKVTQNQLQNAFEYIKNSELQQFDILYKKIFDEHIFDFIPKNQPSLVPAGMHGFIDSTDKAMLSQIIKTTGSITGHDTKFAAARIALTSDVTSKFLATDVGTKMFESMTKDYEQNIFKSIAKDYNKLLDNNSPQAVINIFCKCHELSIVPGNINQDIEKIHTIFKNKYMGLEEFNSTNQYLTMQMRHVFYPNLASKLNPGYQSIRQFDLHGFHHDEYDALKKSGLFTYINKTYGSTKFGAEECFKAKINFGSGIIPKKEKTFFPSSWSREKTVQVIFEAAQNRMKILDDTPFRKQFECEGPNNLIIEIIINSKNTIISAYPSKKNFV